MQQQNTYFIKVNLWKQGFQTAELPQQPEFYLMVLFTMVTEEVPLVKDLNTKHGQFLAQCLKMCMMYAFIIPLPEKQRKEDHCYLLVRSEDSAPLPPKIREIASEECHQSLTSSLNMHVHTYLPILASVCIHMHTYTYTYRKQKCSKECHWPFCVSTVQTQSISIKSTQQSLRTRYTYKSLSL